MVLGKEKNNQKRKNTVLKDMVVTKCLISYQHSDVTIIVAYLLAVCVKDMSKILFCFKYWFFFLKTMHLKTWQFWLTYAVNENIWVLQEIKVTHLLSQLSNTWVPVGNETNLLIFGKCCEWRSVFSLLFF